jgi:hypothetical protein
MDCFVASAFRLRSSKAPETDKDGAKLSLKQLNGWIGGACTAIGAGVAYCGDRYRSYDFAPDAFSRNHGRRRHRM